MAAPYNMQSAFHDSHLENESMKYHLHYPTRKRDNNLPNRNQFLKVCVEIQFIFFNAADGNTPNLHFIFFPSAFQKFTLDSLLFPSRSDRLTYFLQFLHFLMHKYNRAALRLCESFPKLCVGGPVFVRTSQPSSIQHS